MPVSLLPPPHSVLFALGERALLLALLAVAVLMTVSLGRLALDLAGLESDDRTERDLFGGAVGGLLIGLGVFVAGSLGLMNPPVIRAGAVTLLILLMPRMRRLAGEWRAAGRASGALRWTVDLPLTALLLLVVAFTLLFGFAPPLDYDVLEYHAAAPAHYLAEGRIAFWSSNVYAAFPELYEMGMLAAMALTGSKLLGAQFGVLVNAVLLFATFLACVAAGRRAFAPRVGFLAGVFYVACPATLDTAVVQYVEPAQSFFALLAVLAMLRPRGAPGPVGAAVLAGLMAAGSAGCKYPALLFCVVPIGAWLAIRAIAGGTERGRAGLALLAFTAAFAIAWSPWPLRNLAATGNPLYPLAYATFGGGEWDADREARFAQAHRSPPNAAQTIGDRAVRWFTGTEGEGTPGQEGFAPPELPTFHPLVLLFWPLAFFAAAPRRAVFALTLLALAQVLCWYGFTHQVPRFLVPVLPVTCLLSAQGIVQVWKGYLAPVLTLAVWVFLALYAGFRLVMGFAFIGPVAAGVESPEAFHSELDARHDAVRYIRERLPADVRLCLIGEAQTFFFDRPVLFATVFNAHPLAAALEAQGREQAALFDLQDSDPDAFDRRTRELDASLLSTLHALGVTHVYIDWPELERLNRTYACTRDGVPIPGVMSTAAYWRLLLFKQRALLCVARFGRSGENGTYPVDLFEVPDYR
ncbi:MAG: hypothetical protein HYY93_00735 [Planctomycetes bacterium]|nr:hypothetical protein [Planctomycetota bacterium]